MRYSPTREDSKFFFLPSPYGSEGKVAQNAFPGSGGEGRVAQKDLSAAASASVSEVKAFIAIFFTSTPS